jgi:hypothetical protein
MTAVVMMAMKKETVKTISEKIRKMKTGEL